VPARQPSLLSQIGEDTGWRALETLPVLDSRFRRLAFDSEWTGTDWRGEDKPVGYSFALEDGRNFYLPIGHQGGGNLDAGLVHRWMRDNLKGKTIVTLSGKGDLNMSRKMGVDLEALGCKINEVQHKAALLSDMRRSFKMEDLAKDFLGKHKGEIERKDIWQLPASDVGPYAEQDARLTLEIDDALIPKIREEQLERVLDLEDSLIWCTLEMERNGVPLNVNKLYRWKSEINRRFEKIILLIAEGTGVKCNPNSANDLATLFGILGLTYHRTPPTLNYPNGQPSFTDEFLKSVKNEYVQLVREGRALDSLSSKYVAKYAKELINGFLYYQLHQLKGDEYGTIAGRYSSSKVNIQQVFKPSKQFKKIGLTSYMIRELFEPAPGMLWLRADASQIEFRGFVHYSKSERLIKIYNENPEADFHTEVSEICKIDREPAKTINFLMLYGGGRDKLAFQLGLSRTESDIMYEEYCNRFPETRTLMDTVMSVAKNRGYVKTIMGRRARFPNGERLHIALNRVLQGTAADIMKLKLLQAYNERKQLELTIRLTVHDELDGDVPGVEHGKRVKEMLESPIEGLGIRVPILWETKTGANWGACS